MFLENYHFYEVLCSSLFLKELIELIKLILWRSNNQTYHLDCWEILTFSWCGVSILCILGFHLIRCQCRVKAQPILSTWSWDSKPSLLLGFITIIDGFNIIVVVAVTTFYKLIVICIYIGTSNSKDFVFILSWYYSTKIALIILLLLLC